MEFVIWLVRAVDLYLLIGMLFSFYFVASGVNRIDPSARTAGLGFRLLIVPGTIALWPVLARRIVRGQSEPPPECNAHRRAAKGAGS